MRPWGQGEQGVRPWKPEGARCIYLHTPHWLAARPQQTPANREPSAKPQSLHLPSGAKNFVFLARASHRRSMGSLNCSL